MPKNPVCVQCDSTQSLLWRSIEGGKLCHECYLMDGGVGGAGPANPEEVRDESEDAKEKPEEQSPAPARSTKKGGNRWTRARTGAAAAAASASTSSTPNPPKSAPARGRGRRSLFKRTPLKAPTATATVVTSDTVFHNGMYMQVGDIVSMIDEEEDIYYAQIRGFVTDQYCEKSAVITWLLPTKASPPPNRGFDPPTYIIGPEEDLPRKLEYMEFVMHAPSEYYKSNNNPYPPVEAEMISKAVSGFVWWSMEPVDKS